MLPSLPRLAVQSLPSASLKKQYFGFSFLGAAAAWLFAVCSVPPWPQAARPAEASSNVNLRMSSPLRPASEPKGRLWSTDRIAALLLLEQVGNNVAARSQPNLVAFHLGNESAGDVVMVLLVSDSAVCSDELDPVFLDVVDGADVDAVSADHFHMFTNVFEAAHRSSPAARRAHNTFGGRAVAASTITS